MICADCHHHLDAHGDDGCWLKDCGCRYFSGLGDLIHQKGLQMTRRATISASDVPKQRSAYYVRCSTYKDEYGQGVSGWHVERGQYPRPLGGWWMRLTFNDRQGCIVPEFIEAS